MIRSLIAASLLLIGSHAMAAQSLVNAKSQINFTFKQMNTPVDGNFKNFTAKINFNPAKPETAKAEIIVDLASIDVGGPDGNGEAKKKAWFDIASNPKATFTATSVKALGGGKFETKGKLMMKGISHDVSGTMMAKTLGNDLLLEGSIPVLRLQYKVGDGVWADTSTVADEVIVKYKLLVTGKAD
ncbi:YceI family protein [uncultured Deefgea sp.]|uniref:YceI family protein n=1 Tax=uncultured Deefgea sp. TaxID=1304914 RepID=UPI002592E748|nr:YceI family protein [uncultured Deefgea sp.]